MPRAPADSAGEVTPLPLPGARARAWQTGLMRADRLEHASLAFSSGLAVALLTRRPVAALAGGFTLGLAKELWDRRTRHFDGGDLVADAIGAGLAMLAASSLER